MGLDSHIDRPMKDTQVSPSPQVSHVCPLKATHLSAVASSRSKVVAVRIPGGLCSAAPKGGDWLGWNLAFVQQDNCK